MIPEDAEVSMVTGDDNEIGASIETEPAVILAPRENDLPVPPIWFNAPARRTVPVPMVKTPAG